MTALPDFVALCLETLDVIGPVAARRMFGGWGLYFHGRMFALISDETLYLKADAANRPAFEAEGLGPFTYRTRGKTQALGYFQAPPDALEDRTAMRPWALAAVAAADRAAAAKPLKRKRKPAVGRTKPKH